MKLYKKFIELPFYTKVRFVLYPIIVIWEMPFEWLKSIRESKVLINGQWERYISFDPVMAINNLFYKTQWINILKYGRNNSSPILGLGDFNLQTLFYLSLPSSFIYANAGALTTLFGTIFWVFTHLIWIDSNNFILVIISVFIIFFSTVSYAMAFRLQNYQILSLMWYPFAIYATLNGYFIPSAFLWLAASIFGITATFFSVPIVGVVSYLNSDVSYCLVLIPSLLLQFVKIIPLISSNSSREIFVNIAKVIGAQRSKVRYNRNVNMFNIKNIYFVILSLVISISYWYYFDSIPYLICTGLILFIVNQSIFRVADIQSLVLIYSSLVTAEILNSPINYKLLIFLFFALNFHYYFLGNHIKYLPNYSVKLLDIKWIEEQVYFFFKNINGSSKVLFAFSSPQDDYWKIFDGYRNLYELPLFLASKGNFHLLPDWYAINQSNYEGAPSFWGRDIESVKLNCQKWKTSFVIIYQLNNNILNKEWEENGFKHIETLDWSTPKFKDLLTSNFWIQIKRPPPTWFLLKFEGK